MLVRAVLASVALASVGCAVDPYLQCGAKCLDGAAAEDAGTVTDGGADVTADAIVPPADSGGDASCRADGVSCYRSQDCCNGICTSGNRCASSCQMVGTSCSSSPDDCCSSLYCASGTCAQCLGNGTSCTTSHECCSGSCTTKDGGKVCVPD